MSREEAIKKLVELGIPQRYIARMMGVSESPVCQWTQGKQKMSKLAARQFDQWFPQFYWAIDKLNEEIEYD